MLQHSTLNDCSDDSLGAGFRFENESIWFGISLGIDITHWVVDVWVDVFWLS
jgi:hypothetical protein